VAPGESGLGAVTPLPSSVPRSDPKPDADTEQALAHHRLALDAVEEIACAPAQASLLLELCVERARALVRADGAAVELLEDGDELLFAATSGLLRDLLGVVQPVSGTLCGTAIRTGEVVHTVDAQLDLRGNREVAARLGVRGTISLPLHQNRRHIGVLLVVAEQAGAFDDKDIVLLGRLARVASARLDYALARDARRRSEQALAASRQKYRTVLASIDSGIIALDEQDRVVLVNPAAERILGQPAYELVGQRPAWTTLRPDGTAWPPDERPVRVALRERRVVPEVVLLVRRADGQVRWLNATASPLPEGGDGRRGVVICFSDITERRDEAERLRHSERLLAETQRLAHVGSWDYDLAGGRMTWTDEMYRLVGLEPRSIPLSQELCLAVTHPDDRDMLRAAGIEVLRRGGHVTFAVRALLASGEVRHLQVTGEVELGPDGRAVRAWGSAHDVTERHRVQEELRRMALTDPLTGLGNRLLLIGRLREAISRLPHDGGHVTVIAVDLDGLKSVNDTHGHATGDELLRETAARLRSVVREADTVARFGGDEFVLLCAGVEPPGAARLAERIVTEMSAPYHLSGGITAWAGASVGVTVTTDSAADIDRLLAQADRALYAAKGAGGNRYAVAPHRADQGVIVAAGDQQTTTAP
jgi:diguanylate cyclase (GGDEF)-like protein/PAS domain S-box-containing protein